MKPVFKALILSFLFTLFIQISHATHLQGGEISYVRDATNPFKYCFLVKIYTFSKSSARSDQLTINMGDGISTALVVSRTSAQPIPIGYDIDVNYYEFCYTYSSQGAYMVSFQEENRNDGVLNMASSVNTPFSVNCLVTINSTQGFNSSPKFLTNPIGITITNTVFKESLGAYDTDGDSLTFWLVTPKKSRTENVDSYRIPTGLTINPLSGEITWDKPTQAGTYAIAVQVNEWRGGKRIGYVIRDFQILVLEDKPENTGKLPQVSPHSNIDLSNPDGARVETGQKIEFSIVIDNMGTKSVDLHAFSELLENQSAQITSYDSLHYKVIKFKWTPGIAHKRNHAYIIVFRGLSIYPAPSSPKNLDLSILLYVGADVRDPDDYVLGVEEIDYKSKIKVFPNPVDDILNFDFDFQYKELEIKLFDLTGKELLSEKAGINEKISLSTQKLNPGMYFVWIYKDRKLIHWTGIVKK